MSYDLAPPSPAIAGKDKPFLLHREKKEFSEFCGHRPFYFSIFKYETVDNNRKGEKLQDLHKRIEADIFIQAFFMSHVFI